jgi:two-component system, NtrC family, sensor histidine kinase HydH
MSRTVGPHTSGQEKPEVWVTSVNEYTTLPEAPADRLTELAALGELSAVLAHELRNPLSSIKGAAQILQHEWGGEQPQGEFLAIILDEVDALTALTTEFLDFARPMYPELGWAGWNEAVAGAIVSVQPMAADADINIGYEPTTRLPSVLMDRVQMERAIRNVLRNAIQASPHGSTIRVRTYRTSSGVAVEIADEGSGVPGEQLSRIFVPFFTTKVTGTGLGLPVARKITQNHGGDVTARRNDGPGMTFVIHMPAPGDSPE